MKDIRGRHKQLREELRSKLNIHHSPLDKAADFLTEQFGTVSFFFVNAIFFFGWIIINSHIIPNLQTFDEYPYNFLTMLVSLEAIFLSIIVLISQNRQSRVADLREQIDFEINVRAEEEITKNLVILEQIAKKFDIHLDHDTELKEMERRTDVRQLQQRVEEEREIDNERHGK